MEKVYECPVNDWDCPYFDGGICTIGNPVKECDDYFYAMGDEEDE